MFGSVCCRFLGVFRIASQKDDVTTFTRFATEITLSVSD